MQRFLIAGLLKALASGIARSAIPGAGAEDK
jgi:hypothetical protein